MIFAILELLLAMLVILGVVTQVIIPLFKQTPFFPAFKSNSSIERELAAAKEKVELAELENRRDQYLKQAEDLRKPQEKVNDQQ
jgi:hypothetical protein